MILHFQKIDKLRINIIIDRVNEQREKDKFFRLYRHKWSRVFGRMTLKQENQLWEMWIGKRK